MKKWLENLFGKCSVRLTTANPGNALTFYTDRGFMLQNPKLASPVTLCFELSLHRLEALRLLAEKRGEGCEVTKQWGLHRWVAALWRRKYFVCAFSALLAFSLYAPGRIWFVEIQGNQRVPEEEIRAAVEQCGVRFWSRIPEIRSETVKNQLLNLVPELQWAGVNFQGGIAVVSVQERLEEQTTRPVSLVSDLVSAKDGIVLSMNVLGGQSLCKPGQAITKGEVLVTGRVEHEFQTQYTQAEGEIYALTQYDLTSVFPRFWTQKVYTGRKDYAISLVLGKKKIKILGNSGISDTTCDKMSSVKALTLPGGYRLPVSLVVDTYRHYENQPVEEEKAEAVAGAAMERCVRDEMLAGEILDSTLALSEEEEFYRFCGLYTCREMVARKRNVILFEGEEDEYDGTSSERGTGGGSD